jgi:CDP-diacylglycerol--serine O-phosphatidyltransferase
VCDGQISFGMAPAACAFALGFRTFLDTLLLSFFVLCGLSRLARFNVTVQSLPKDETGKSKYFEGTPIPTTLGIVFLMAYWASKGLLLEKIPLGTVGEGLWEFHPAVLIFCLSGCAMVSKSIHIPKI